MRLITMATVQPRSRSLSLSILEGEEEPGTRVKTVAASFAGLFTTKYFQKDYITYFVRC